MRRIDLFNSTSHFVLGCGVGVSHYRLAREVADRNQLIERAEASQYKGESNDNG